MIKEKKSLIPIIIIQGPTGVGKSKLALDLAEKLKTEIISADSRQVYKLLNIGTAKPSKTQQARIKHYLIDIIYPNEIYNAVCFQKDAKKIIYRLNKEEKIPLIVGGTGFYIKTLWENLFEIPPIPESIRKRLRENCKEKGNEYIYKYLEKVDNDSAKRINQNDSHRILRALEVWEATGKTISEYWKEQSHSEEEFLSLKILINEDRGILYRKINKRVDEMINLGLLDEIKNLLEMGYKPEDPGMNTVGYKEFFPYFFENSNLDECIELVKKNTRHYAKRQFTWFRKIDFDLTFTISDINIYDILYEINKWISKYNYYRPLKNVLN